MKKYDVVIIGSGVSSLTSAAILSKKGYSVCVLEQHTKPGGYMHCFSRFGERFDTGAHYVGALDRGQPFHTLLTYLNAYDPSVFVPLDPTGFDVFRFPEFEIQFPKGYAQVINVLTERFPTEALAIQSFFSEIQTAVQCFPTYEFSDETIDQISVMRAIETPLSVVVQRLTKNADLQAVLYSYCTLHGVIPSDAPFGLHAIMMDSIIRGPYGFAKGGDAFTETLVRAIQKNGGEVHLRKRVNRIEIENGNAKAVHAADGGRYEGKWVLSGCHPKHTFQLVDRQEVFSPAFRERMKNIKETVGIFGIYGLSSQTHSFNPLKNYYYFSNQGIENAFNFGSPNSKPSAAFLCPASRTLSAGAEKFPFSLHAASPMGWFSDWRDSSFGKRPDDYRQQKEVFAEQVFKFVGEYHPHFRESLSKYVTSSPVTNLHYNGSEEGSSYGIYHSIQNTGARALGPRTHVPNLLITGQSTLFPGILGAAVAGLRTAGHIVGIKPILKELKEIKLANGC